MICREGRTTQWRWWGGFHGVPGFATGYEQKGTASLPGELLGPFMLGFLIMRIVLADQAEHQPAERQGDNQECSHLLPPEPGHISVKVGEDTRNRPYDTFYSTV